MDIQLNTGIENTKKIISFLKSGGKINVFSPYFLKHDVFYDSKGNALKFSDEVVPNLYSNFKVGSYFKVGYELGWMLEGLPCEHSMCSISDRHDFITRWQYTIKKIIEIDRIKQSYKTSDEVQSFDRLFDNGVFDCSYSALLSTLKRAKLTFTISELGSLSLI